jgi:hypothetical protein
MKYIKTFEGFSINEDASNIGGIFSLVNGEISKLSEEERQKLMDDAKAISNKLGVSLEQLKNPEVAVKAMIEETENIEVSIEEGWLSDSWDWLKGKSASWYRTVSRVVGFGGAFTSLATAIAAAAIGSAERNSFSLYLRDLTGVGELDRNTQAAVFMAGLAGVAISIIAGIALGNKADDLEQAAKYGTKF